MTRGAGTVRMRRPRFISPAEEARRCVQWLHQAHREPGKARSELLMPQALLTTPPSIMPADRLTLGATDARCAGAAAPHQQGNYCATCIAEE